MIQLIERLRVVKRERERETGEAVRTSLIRVVYVGLCVDLVITSRDNFNIFVSFVIPLFIKMVII